jgi:hypothetical protein
MSNIQIYAPLKQALEKKAEEEIMKLLGENPTSTSITSNFLIKVSIENSGSHQVSPSVSFLGLPKLDGNKPHIGFQNSLTEDIARMLQHTC